MNTSVYGEICVDKEQTEQSILLKLAIEEIIAVF